MEKPEIEHPIDPDPVVGEEEIVEELESPAAASGYLTLGMLILGALILIGVLLAVAAPELWPKREVQVQSAGLGFSLSERQAESCIEKAYLDIFIGVESPELCRYLGGHPDHIVQIRDDSPSTEVHCAAERNPHIRCE